MRKEGQRSRPRKTENQRNRDREKETRTNKRDSRPRAPSSFPMMIHEEKRQTQTE
jgi:hypothetical protein